MKLFLSVFLTISFFSSAVFAEPVVNVNGRTYRLGKYFSETKDPKQAFSEGNILRSDSLLHLKDYQSAVKSQGNRGTCAFFSVTALFESAIIKYLGDSYKDVNLSEEYMIWYEKAHMGHSSGGDGSIAGYNVKAFKRGFMLERDMPYNVSWFEKGLPCQDYKEEGAPSFCYSHYKPTPEMLSKINKSLDYRVYRMDSYASQIVNSMSSRRLPVVVGVPTHSKGWAREDGYVWFNDELKAECDQGSDECGGHSILLTGYDVSKKIFYFKNSWSVDWGKTGYGTIGFDYIDKYSRSSAYTLTVNRIDLPEVIEGPTPAESNIADTAYEVVPDFVKNGEPGVLVRFGFVMNYLQRATAYSSAFLVYKPYEGSDYQLIKKNDGKSYVADRYHWLMKDSNNLDITAEPVEFFVPYSDFNTSTVAGKEVAIRLSAYLTTDMDSYVTIYRTFAPFEL